MFCGKWYKQAYVDRTLTLKPYLWVVLYDIHTIQFQIVISHFKEENTMHFSYLEHFPHYFPYFSNYREILTRRKSLLW